MAYKHGVYTSETPTSILPSVAIESGLIFCVGTSAQHLAKNPAGANNPVLCYELSEFVDKFGYDTDFNKYTLSEMASSQFQLFNISPIVFVNVLDAEKHFTECSELKFGVTNHNPILEGAVILDTIKITSTGETSKVDLIKDADYRADISIVEGEEITTVEIKVGVELPSDVLELNYTVDGEEVTEIKNISEFPITLPTDATDFSLKAIITPVSKFILNEDYTAAYNDDNKVEIQILNTDKVFDDTIEVNYHQYAPEKVTKSDIIGGYDSATGKYSGLELVEQIYPKFRLTPGIIVAPKFSTDVTVAAVMKAKCTDINGVFNAVAVCDIPTDEIKSYTDVSEYKNLNNLIDTNLIVCYPKVSLGGVQYHLSTQLASLINKVDAQQGGGIPYISPSNKNLQIDSCCLSDGTEIFLSLEQANYLNGQGIVTALNFSNGWVAWGNRTSIYPSSTDVKDTFIAIRRMFYWLRNTLILTYFSKVDYPTNKRLLESIIDSVQIFLNGLTAKGALNGGRIVFLSSENPTTDLMDGILKFHLFINVPSPAREIDFILEYDPSYLSGLFD